MKIPFATLVLAFALVLLFIGIGNANSLEELRDIFTKNRNKPPAEQQDTQSELAAPKPSPASTPDGLVLCGSANVLNLIIHENGNLFYHVGGLFTPKTVTRLAGNINNPVGQAMFQMLLSNPYNDAVGVRAKYPAGYDCMTTNLETPAIALIVRRTKRGGMVRP